MEKPGDTSSLGSDAALGGMPSPSRGAQTVCGMVRQPGPDGVGNHPAGRADPGFPALSGPATCWPHGLRSMPSEISFSLRMPACNFARSTGFSRSNRRRLRWPNRAGSTPRCCGSILGSCGVARRPAAGRRAVAVAVRRCSDFRRSRISMRPSSSWPSGMLLTLPSNLVAGALPRARALWTRGQGCRMLGHAGRAVRPAGRDRHDRKPAWPSPSPMSPRRCWPRSSF